MDGNGRWARKRLLPRIAGHRQGVQVVRRLLGDCARRGIRVLTLFAFSSENWNRPVDEVEGLMALFMTSLEREVPDLVRNDVRLRFIGDRETFSTALRDRIVDAEQATASCQGLQLVIAAAYGGRWDIARAARHLAEAVAAGHLDADGIDETALGGQLATADLPEPDLLIRTGGERRLSNFLLWQCAYTELYFTDVLWPDFDEAEFDRALGFFASRERRYGRIPEQLSDTHA